MILTNNGELSRALELPENNIERQYKVRVFGRMFNETKLDKIRADGPYITEIINRQTTNTWLHMKLFGGKKNEIRRVMRKHSLRVNRLKRVAYGPYTLGLVPNPNDLVEVNPNKVEYLLKKEERRKAKENALNGIDILF